jgi:hypothetical protein
VSYHHLLSLRAIAKVDTDRAIAEEFFKNQYSTDQRYVMLNALALGAHELAGLPLPRYGCGPASDRGSGVISHQAATRQHSTNAIFWRRLRDKFKGSYRTFLGWRSKTLARRMQTVRPILSASASCVSGSLQKSQRSSNRAPRSSSSKYACHRRSPRRPSSRTLQSSASSTR